MSGSSVVKSVRLQRDLADRLDAQARVEHRTVNNLITAILTEGLDQRPVSPTANPLAGRLATDLAANSKDTPA